MNLGKVEAHIKNVLAGLHNSNVINGSSVESVAKAFSIPEQFGNFKGWRSYRKDVVGESGDD